MKRPIPWWKIVSGAAVHCIVPAYALALAVDGWLALRAGSGLAGWLALVEAHAPWFFGLYGGGSLIATAAATLVDGAQQLARPASPPLAPDLRAILAAGRGAFGAEADSVLDAIGALAPDATDPPTARALRDLGAMIEAARAGLAAASTPAARDEVATVTRLAMARIAGDLAERDRIRRQDVLDHTRVMATYVESAYGPEGPK